MNKVFKHENMQKLNSEERRKIIPPQKVLDLMQINDSDTLLDVGAGIGYFALPAIEYVGRNGKVIASDISKEMLAEIEKNKSDTTENLDLVLSGTDSIPLKDGSVDKILMAFVFHEIDDQEQYLKEMARLIKSGGDLTIVEWDKIDSPMGPPLEDRLDHNDLLSITEKSDFSIIKHEQINPYQYLCILKKK